MNSSTVDNYFSKKITILSFFLCCGVVSQHVKWTCLDYETLNSIRDFWFFIVETCVPFFFIVSGYLFFRTYQSDNWKKKLKSRINSLLVPYLLWNVFYSVVMLLLFKAGFVTNIQRKEGLLGVVTSCINSEYSPLWFIKDLMVFVCISPMMYYLLRNKYVGALVLIALVTVNANNFYSGRMTEPLNVNANDWIMFIYQYIFFALGSYGALCWKLDIEKSSSKRAICGLIMLSFLIIIYWAYLCSNGDVINNHTFRWLWCISFWFAYDLFPEIRVYPWMKYSFFIYCAHLIIVMCIQGVSQKVFSYCGGLTCCLQITEYIALPIVTIICIICIANLLKKHMPQLLLIITGGRG